MATDYEIKSKINTYLNMTEGHLDKFHKLYEWCATAFELTVQEKSAKPVVREGDIFYSNLGVNVGSEIDYTRPCVITSTNIHNSTGTTYTIAPITNSGCDFTYHIPVDKSVVEMRDSNEDMLTGIIKVEASKSISKARLGRKVGRLTPHGLLMVKKAILAYHNIDLNVISTLFPSASTIEAESNMNDCVKYVKDQIIKLKGSQIISLKGEQDLELKDGRVISLKNGQTLTLQDGQTIMLKDGQVLPLNNTVSI